MNAIQCSSLDPVITLPDEVSIYIFSFLDDKSLAIASQVNKAWHSLISDPQLWSNFIKQLNFIGDVPRELRTKSFIAQLSTQRAQSNDAVIDHLQKFLDKVTLNQPALFRCIIGWGKAFRQITVEIVKNNDKGEVPASIRYEIKDDCYVNSIGSGTLNRNKQSSDVALPDRMLRLYHWRYTTPPLIPPITTANRDRVFSAPGLKPVEIQGPYCAFLQFPSLPGTTIDNTSDMEKKIVELMHVKITELNKKESEMKAEEEVASSTSYIDYASIASVALISFGIFFLKH